MNYKILFLFLFLFPLTAEAQETEVKVFNHGVSLLGSGVINQGVNYSLIKNLPSNFSFGGLVYPTTRRTYSVTGNIGMYWDPFSHMGLQNYYNVNVQSNVIGRLYFEYGLGVGWQARFTRDNYVVTKDFEVTRRGLMTNTYTMIDSFAGFKLEGKNSDSSTNLRTHLTILTNYNGSFLPSFMLELGKEF